MEVKSIGLGVDCQHGMDEISLQVWMSQTSSFTQVLITVDIQMHL